MARKKEDIVKDGEKTQFSSTNQPKNAGRKKKIYTILKEKGYSKDDIVTAFGEMAWYTLAELQAVHKDEKKPIIMRIVSNQLFLALKKGDWTKIKEILEHVIGKPTQKQQIDANINMGIEERRAKAQRLIDAFEQEGKNKNTK